MASLHISIRMQPVYWHTRGGSKLTFRRAGCYFSGLMASYVPNNWKGHLGNLVSELCFKNALGGGGGT